MISSRITYIDLKIGDIIGYTDEQRTALRIGMIKQSVKASTDNIDIWSLGMKSDQSAWALDGRIKYTIRKDVVCVLYPQVHRIDLIVTHIFKD